MFDTLIRVVEFAAEIGVTRIILEGDSQFLINTLNSGGKSLAHFGHLTTVVLFFAFENFNAFKVSHVCRQYNKVEHVLAKEVNLVLYRPVYTIPASNTV